jgi:L-aminopeptidase/D-esterase-like protein
MVATGPRNLITDIPGLLVGNAEDFALGTGVTIVRAERPVVAAVDVRGGGPGTRETDLLAPENLVEHIDALALAGGSAFGLSAAAGVQRWLREQDRGFDVAGVRVPIVPAAILFDLRGRIGWQGESPYPALGYRAMAAASEDFALGSVGAGTGATTLDLKGGLGSASEVAPSGFLVAALAAVNAVGAATVGDGPHFRAAPFEIGGEFGGLGLPHPWPEEAREIRHKAGLRENTTLAVVATDARLTRAMAKRLAIAAHDGLARALYPVHTPFDGDVVFALATGDRPLGDPPRDLAEIGAVAANCLSRAIARGVFEATAVESVDKPAWRDRFAAS